MPTLKWTTETRVQAGFALALACIVVIATTSYLSLRRLTEDAGRVAHTDQALVGLRRATAITQATLIGGGGVALAFVGLSLIVIRRDFAGRRRAERALREANDQLEKHVRERTAELVQANDSLEKSESRFRAFVGATSDVIYRMSPDWTEMYHLQGLGLAMVYGTMQRHGADLDVQSAVGEGTTVRLSFAVPAAGPSAVPPSAAPPAVAPLRILIVDDDPLVLKALRLTLEADGHVVIAADGGRAGIDAFMAREAAGEGFQVVITDLGMPYVDGRKVAAAVKSARPETPVLLLTGWGRQIIMEGDLPAHVDRVLSKPVKLGELRETFAQLARPGGAPGAPDRT